MAKACSHILVTVATLDKRAYKYIPGKKKNIQAFIQHSTSCSPQHDQSRLARTKFICIEEILFGFAGANDRNDALPFLHQLQMKGIVRENMEMCGFI